LLIFKKKIDKLFLFLITIFFVALIYLLSITPGLKGDLEQSLRILLKQPVLLKSKAIHDNTLINYSLKIFYAIENRLFNSSKFHELKIDIKFSELEKIKKDRKKALKIGQLDNPQKVAINITHLGKNYSATARLKGDLSEHWGNQKQWSLRIKLKNKKTIFSMNEFSITIFSERDFPYNFVISDIFKNYNILAPRYETVNVSVNGNDWGIMLVEEQFNDSFYASNKIKEAPIFKMTNENDFFIEIVANGNISNIKDIIKWQGKLETKIYNENEILNKSNIPDKGTNDTLVSIFKTLQEATVLENENHISFLEKYINIKSFAKVSAISAVFGDLHSSLPTNSRYYLSPYDLKIQPILTDSNHSLIDINFFNEKNIFYQTIYQTEEFQLEYLKTLNDIKDNFFKIENNFIQTCKNYGIICQNLVELDTLKKNINFLKLQDKKIFQKKNNKQISNKKFNTKNKENLNKKKINFRVFDDGDIVIDNLTSEYLKIDNIKLKNSKNCLNECDDLSKNVKASNILKPSSYNFLSTKNIEIDLKGNEHKFLEINYFDENNESYSNTEKIEKKEFKKENFFKKSDFNLNKNIIIKDQNYILNTGNYFINEPIIVPSGFNFIIQEGSTLKMSENSYIMVENGVVKLDGKNDKPIKIFSQNKGSKWKGIYVNYDSTKEDFSMLNYVHLSDYSYFNNEKIQLTGGINFINSNVKIYNSALVNSYAEDALNLVNSKFLIKNTDFKNSISDGIDIDFGIGKITESNFDEILGDAIDLSGSNVSISNINAINIGDKAISAGEETVVKLNQLNISSSRIGLASKDSSIVEGSNIKISNCGLYDFAAYQKKSYFSGAFLKIQANSTCDETFVQEGSELIVNNKVYNSKNLDIKKLYDGTL